MAEAIRILSADFRGDEDRGEVRLERADSRGDEGRRRSRRSNREEASQGTERTQSHSHTVKGVRDEMGDFPRSYMRKRMRRNVSISGIKDLY